MACGSHRLLTIVDKSQPESAVPRQHVKCSAALLDASRGFAIVGDDAVANVNYAMRVLRDVMLVGDEHNGVSLRVQGIHESHDLISSLGIKISGGLVGENDRGSIH